MRRISFLLLIYCFYSATTFAEVPANDSTYVERHFSTEKIESFKADSEFVYGRPMQVESFWDRILYWLIQVIDRIFYFTTNTWIGKALLYGSAILLLGYVVLKLLKIDAKNLFYKSSPSNMLATSEHENIHELNFDKLIAQAVEKRNYREAVRLTFLYSLKKLADANLIKWVPGKTNDDYMREIKNHPSLPRIMELRYYFDYAWYGHFEIDPSTYTAIQNAFAEFNQTIKK
ncbi:MAG: DUF4129 domain-containing protein [Cyclobacteriaceae bacterium]|nr:DUF4129 domain-containing protein [Cyclobacteriaceae bacterium]